MESRGLCPCVTEVGRGHRHPRMEVGEGGKHEEEGFPQVEGGELPIPAKKFPQEEEFHPF